MRIKEKKNLNKIYIILIIMCSTLLAIPSIVYIAQNKTIYRFIWLRTFFLRRPVTRNEALLNALIFFILFSCIFLLYILILKNYKKIFKSKKQIFALILIVAVLFMIVIPCTSSDVYSYIATGWSAAHYKENPYYISPGQIVDNTGQNEFMFNKVAANWRYETAVYGPLWTMICTVLSWMSFGNIDIALLVFKLVNLMIHLINCRLIYKITKKNLFVIIYGLNPCILFEALSNVHNDIFIILFVLLAIYFVTKKKNLFLAVMFIAMATAVKYLAILILPFIVLYAVKEKNIKTRIKCCVFCGIEYIAVLGLFYCIYLRDFQVLAGLFIQQGKYNRSVFFLLYWFLRDRNMNIVSILQNITLTAFTIYYIYVVVKILLQKEIKWNDVMKKYHIILMLFTFIVITNFNPWYIMWLFPTVIWTKGMSIKNVLNLSYASQMGNILGFALYSEEEVLGIPYFIIMIVLTIILNNVKDKKIEKGKINER